jgi:chromosomal replication initiation ATPase DnaA
MTAAIVKAVSATSGIPVANILGRGRPKAVSDARQVAYYVSRSLGHSYPAIARAFGRDRATIIHGVRAIDGQIRDCRSAALRIVECFELLGWDELVDTACFRCGGAGHGRKAA